MKTKILLPALALTLLSTSVFVVNDAEARGCPFGGGHGGMYIQDADITDEQREQARAIAKEGNEKIAQIKDKMFVKHQELEALQNAANPDVAAVSKTSNELVELRNQLRAEKEKLGADIDKALGLKAGTHAFGGHNRGNGHGYGNGRGHGNGHGKGHY